MERDGDHNCWVCKDFEGGGLGDTITPLTWRNWGRPRNTAVVISCNRAAIQTGQLSESPDRSIERYCYPYLHEMNESSGL
jgi:hypothetical protein